MVARHVRRLPCCHRLCRCLIASSSRMLRVVLARLRPSPQRLRSAPSASPRAVPGRSPRRAHGATSERSRRSARAPSASRPQQLGAPYRYAGMSPSGFDCSGLVAYVYGKLGCRPSRTTLRRSTAYGRPVGRSQLRPGDLVFFHGLGHVGLYIGRGRIIHSPQSGERVEIQSLAERSGSVAGARRLVRA